MTARPGEFALIARYLAPLAAAWSGAYGLTDDAATLPATGPDPMVVTTDALVAGVHFLPDDPPDLVARKALRVNLSDLAAKGATPLGYLLDLVLPDAIDEAWIAAFTAGLAQDQAEYGVALVGGDTTRTPGPLTLAVTAFGRAGQGGMLRRAAARPGQDVYVTGTIGDAALGLAVLQDRLATLGPAAADALVARYRLPQPRVRFGVGLAGLAAAAMDVSDGLVADLGHIAAASGVGAVIEDAAVPLSEAARAALALDAGLRGDVLGGGDDYEILFTAEPAQAGAVARLAHEAAVPATRIGSIVPGAGVRVIGPDGSDLTPRRGGWTHF